MLLNNLPQNSWNQILSYRIKELKDIQNKIEDKKEELKPLKVFPEQHNIFNAFKLCSFEDLKVVIIGQDCYHGPSQANGLCFSVNEGLKHPPSLRNILKEMESDIGSKRESSDFTSLAKQGVLLLNSSLTVSERLAGSHIKFWESYTDYLIKYISENKTDPIVFILWGNFAINKSKFIDQKKHAIISGKHPSPLSANRGGFFGKKYFSKCNEILKNNNLKGIDWLN